MKNKQEFTKYERARILGARGLQISMDAPLLLKIDEDELISMNYDPIKIAEKELDAGVLPITVKKPMPERGDEREIEKMKIDESTPTDGRKLDDDEDSEKEVVESGDVVLTESDDDLEEKASLSGASEDSDDDKI
jgi:DNA-directed RNA polymerase subunit K/omega